MQPKRGQSAWYSLSQPIDKKMKTPLASYVFVMDNSYFKEAKPSIDEEQKKEAVVFRLIRAAETCNHFKT